MYRARKREVQTKPGWKSLHRVKQEGGKKVGERDLGSVLEERPRERQRENGQLRERERGGKHRWRRHYILAGSSFGCQFLGCTRLRVYLYSTNDIFVTLSKPGRNWQSLWDREETACCSFFFKSRTLESKDNYCLLEISSSGSIFFLFFFPPVGSSNVVLLYTSETFRDIDIFQDIRSYSSAVCLCVQASRGDTSWEEDPEDAAEGVRVRRYLGEDHKKRTMATYATYRHVELDNVGYGKKR